MNSRKIFSVPSAKTRLSIASMFFDLVSTINKCSGCRSQNTYTFRILQESLRLTIYKISPNHFDLNLPPSVPLPILTECEGNWITPHAYQRPYLNLTFPRKIVRYSNNVARFHGKNPSIERANASSGTIGKIRFDSARIVCCR